MKSMTTECIEILTVNGNTEEVVRNFVFLGVLMAKHGLMRQRNIHVYAEGLQRAKAQHCGNT